MRLIVISFLLFSTGCKNVDLSDGNCDPETFDISETLTEMDVQRVVGNEWQAGDALTDEECAALCEDVIGPGYEATVENCAAAWFEGDADVSGVSLDCDGSKQIRCM